jgi:membrane associated rhomboid family serine protease
MFIPLKDLNPRRTFPVVNVALILANVAVFLYQVSLQVTLSPVAYKAFVITYSTVPQRFPAFLAAHAAFSAAFLPLVTSMFLHAGLMHILGNMLFLYIFGDNVEDYFGHLGYLVFYLVCGIGAGLLHIAFNLNSPLPALGASGAISGVMGAYLLLYPRARVLTLVLFFVVPIPAVIILGYWFLLQFLAGVGSLGGTQSGGVAVWAHIGGFLLGMLITAIASLR